MADLSEEDVSSVSPEGVVSIYLDDENLRKRADDHQGEKYPPHLL